MSNSRLRGAVVASVMAGVLMSWLGATAAMAQGGNSIAGVACEVSFTEGNAENGEPNYVATANRAEFAFLAPMTAVVDKVSLFSSELGGAAEEGVAAIKGAIARDRSGAMTIESLQLAWPFTVLERDGQYYSIIQMAHDQDVRVGLSIELGGEALGEIDFPKGAFDPNQPVIGFDSDAVGAIHQGLLSNEPLVMNLVVGGEIYSRVAPQPGAYRTFVDETLTAAMDEAGRRDAEDPCLFTNPDAFLELLDF